MNASNKIAFGFFVSYIIIALALVVGWVMNIFTLLATSPPLAEFGVGEVLRVIGVFILPLGGILGYF